MYRKDFKKKEVPVSRTDIKSVQMSQIPPLVTYKNSAKVQLTQEKAKLIKEKLALDATALESYSRRAFYEDYYVKYDYNPLCDFEEQHEKFYVGQDTKIKQHELRGSVQAQKCKDIPKTDKKNLLGAAFNIQPNKRDIKTKLDLQILRGIEKYIGIPQPHQIKQKHQEYEKQDKLVASLNEVQERQMSFDEILSMKDENFFEKNRKIDNLFYLVFRRDNEFKTNIDYLDEHYFCHESIKETSKTKKIPIFRDMSQFARRCTRNLKVKQEKVDILLDNEINLGKDDYNYHTMMAMASGRLSHADMEKMLKEGNAFDLKDDLQPVLEEKQHIFYAEKTKHSEMNHWNKNHDAEEHRLFVNYPYTQEEKNKLQQITNLYLQMKEKKDAIQYSILRNIRDEFTLSYLNYEKIKKLDQIVNFNEKVFRTRDEQIRRNKIHKTRDDIIKIKALTNAIKLQKEANSMLAGDKKKKVKRKRLVTSEN